MLVILPELLLKRAAHLNIPTHISHHYRERVLNATSGSLQELNVQGLQPGSAYEFRVVAHNQHGIGESSQPLRVSIIFNLGCQLPI